MLSRFKKSEDVYMMNNLLEKVKAVHCSGPWRLYFQDHDVGR